MSEEIPFISYNMLESGFTPKQGYYWSDDFSEDFYISLAKKGLISISNNYKEFGDILLPEMQEAYAVLYFKDLHINSKVKKLFKLNYKLIINQDLDCFITLLKNHHGDECWFTDSYIEVMYKLKGYSLLNDNFKLHTIFLEVDNIITAGEIGYFIGKTYTSLTGFYNKGFSNHGTFQLVLLAKELERRGLLFWNLGHPYMDYKTKLGARILQNRDFLSIWNRATTLSI